MRTVTTRTVGGRNHWIVIFAYLVVGYTGLAYVAYNVVDGNSVTAGGMMIVLTLVLSVGGLVTMYKLFRDAIALRQQSAGWRPSWIRYVAGGLGLPAAVFIAGDQLGLSDVIGITFVVYLVCVLGANTLYVWRRHKFLGRP